MQKFSTRASFFVGVLATVVLSSDMGFAQDSTEQATIYKKHTVFSFEGDTIDGDLRRPDGAYIEARKELTHSNLIKVREDFRLKILESVIYL